MQYHIIYKCLRETFDSVIIFSFITDDKITNDSNSLKKKKTPSFDDSLTQRHQSYMLH